MYNRKDYFKDSEIGAVGNFQKRITLAAALRTDCGGKRTGYRPVSRLLQ